VIIKILLVSMSASALSTPTKNVTSNIYVFVLRSITLFLTPSLTYTFLFLANYPRLWKDISHKGVNRQLPPEIVSFANYPPEINKTSIYPFRQILLLVNMMFCKYPPEVLHLCAKCPPNLKIYIFYSYALLKRY